MALILGAVLVRDRHQISVADRINEQVRWWLSRHRGAHLYASGPLGHARWGTHQLPGIAACLRLSEHTDSWGRVFALIYCPVASTYTVVVEVEPDGASLVDEDRVDQWVAAWGHWLANLGNEPGVRQATVTVETAPDTGARLQRQVLGTIAPRAPAFARQVMETVAKTYPAGGSMTRAWLAVTFSAITRARGVRRPMDQVAKDLATRLPGLTSSLNGTGVGGTLLLDAQGLCEVVRVAYDPRCAVQMDTAKADGQTPDLHWSDVGPSYHVAGRDHYEHDNALSATWVMTVAPRGVVQSRVLERLLSPHPDLARKRVTVVYRPHDAARTAAIVEADVRKASVAATASRRTTARASHTVSAARATANEEARGAGLVQFAVLVTVTGVDQDLEGLQATVDDLAGGARLSLRPAYGSQPAAFAAALPLGLNLSTYQPMPDVVRENL